MDLPKHPVVHGHPIHAILSDGPVVLIPMALAAELWDRTRNAGGLRLGDVVTAGAATTASAAAIIGWIDWLTIPPEPEAAAALRVAQGAREPGIVVGVSASQARAWRSLVRFDLVIRNGVPVDRIAWSDQAGREERRAACETRPGVGRGGR